MELFRSPIFPNTSLTEVLQKMFVVLKYLLSRFQLRYLHLRKFRYDRSRNILEMMWSTSLKKIYEKMHAGKFERIDLPIACFLLRFHVSNTKLKSTKSTCFSILKYFKIQKHRKDVQFKHMERSKKQATWFKKTEITDDERLKPKFPPYNLSVS